LGFDWITDFFLEPSQFSAPLFAEDSAGYAAGIQTEPDHVISHGRSIIRTGEHIVWRVLSWVLIRQKLDFFGEMMII
jgi:hypothetical protein